MRNKWISLIGFALLMFLSFSFGSNASAAELLTQEQKTQYYQEYLKIADELREEYPNAITFNVAAFEDIIESDWVEPEQYRENLISIIAGGITFVVEDIKSPKSSISTFSGGAGNTPTKYATAKSSNGTVLGTVVVTATVSTVHDASLGGQVISNISGVNSYTMQSQASWSQNGASNSKVSARSWNVKLTGNFYTGGTNFPQAFTINYKCTATGTIS